MKKNDTSTWTTRWGDSRLVTLVYAVIYAELFSVHGRRHHSLLEYLEKMIEPVFYCRENFFDLMLPCILPAKVFQSLGPRDQSEVSKRLFVLIFDAKHDSGIGNFPQNEAELLSYPWRERLDLARQYISSLSAK